MLEAIVFAITDLSFVARSAREDDDAGEFRLAKIQRIIQECKYVVHDISAVQLDVENDYDPKILGPDKIGAVDCLKVELIAKHDEAPYAKVIYFVEAKGYFPVQAQFYGVSGKLLKTMSVEEKAELAGMVRPKVLKMVDAVINNHVSWWQTEKIVQRQIPDTVFTTAYLEAQ